MAAAKSLGCSSLKELVLVQDDMPTKPRPVKNTRDGRNSEEQNFEGRPLVHDKISVRNNDLGSLPSTYTPPVSASSAKSLRRAWRKIVARHNWRGN